MLGTLSRWWAKQMLDLAPERLRHNHLGPATALVLAVEQRAESTATEVVARQRRARRETEIARFVVSGSVIETVAQLLERRRRDMPLVFQVPRGWLLEREVMLPLAAEEQLARVLQYEMDRLTPFKADDVYWGFEVTTRDRDLGSLRLRLSLVPRAGLAVLMAAVQAAGAAPALLEVALNDGRVRRLRMQQTDTRRAQARRRAFVLVVWACAGLAVAAVVQPFVLQSIARARIERQIAGLQPGLTRVDALRRRIAATAAGAGAFAAEQGRVGDALQMLAAVTGILPDDTYLTRFELRDRTLTLEGNSAAAAKLIGALSADPLIRDAGFAAPVTRSETGADVFTIRATLAP